MSQITFNFFPLTLQMNWVMDLTLPKDFNADEKLPLVYLLHDDREDASAWARNIGLERIADKYHVALVSTDGAQGLYTDMKDGYDFYQYYAVEWPERLHKGFNPVTADWKKTIIVGKGVGGYAAAKWALRNPEAPAGVVVADPVLQIENWYKEIEANEPERLHRLINAWGENAAYLPEENHLDHIVRVSTGEKIPYDVFRSAGKSGNCTPEFAAKMHENFAMNRHDTEETDAWAVAEQAIRFGIETYLK